MKITKNKKSNMILIKANPEEFKVIQRGLSLLNDAISQCYMGPAYEHAIKTAFEEIKDDE